MMRGADDPTGDMAVFEPLDPDDKNRYAATEVYFESLHCREGLRNHFAGISTEQGISP
jgi:hypothetical protein